MQIKLNKKFPSLQRRPERGLKMHWARIKIFMVCVLVLAETEARRESTQPLEDEPKMQLSMIEETGDRHDALRAR